MNIRKILKNLYLIIFVAIGIIGIASVYNWFDYYNNDKKINNEWNASLGSKFETEIASTFLFKNQLIDINGLFRRIIGQREMNEVIKLNNGYLFTTVPKTNDDVLKKYASNINKFNEYCNENGIKYLYSIAPNTLSKYDNQLPVGIEDYGNSDADKLVKYIKDYNVDVLDIREEMYKDGINQYDMMYKTDHHWTTEAGFYVYTKIEDYITNNFDCDVDARISDINFYDICKYDKWHLGTRGQRTGKYYAGIDDLDLLIPKFPTLIKNDNGDVGNMQNIVYDVDSISKRNIRSSYAYANVFDKSLNHHINISSNNNIKVLMITDSMGLAVNPFLIIGFSEFMCVQNYTLSKDLTPELISNYKPDVIINLNFIENAVTLGTIYDFNSFFEQK